MFNTSETNDYEDIADVQIDHMIDRKIVRIKRTARLRLTRQKPKKARTNTEDDFAGGTVAASKETTTDVIIPHTFSFDNDNWHDKFSEADRRHLVRVVWIEKRKAVQNKDSTGLRSSPKRIKLDEDEIVHGSSKESDTPKSNFQPDCDLIVTWL
jgi:hypothetical protein